MIRGKSIKTTISDKAAPCPLDHVNRQFKAPRPNVLWLSDFTYVATWTGFVYVAFVIDAYARRIVGWRASRTAHAGFVLDALEQALHDRRPVHRGGLVHHSDRGSQYVSIKYTERLAEAGVEPSVGSVGDSYDNALAETINGLYKAEVIHRRGPWRNFEAVEFATLGMGRLVQQPTAPGAHRQHPAGRSRATLLRHAGTTGHGGVILNQMASGNPGAVHHDHAVLPLTWPIAINGRLMCSCRVRPTALRRQAPFGRLAPNGLLSASTDEAVIRKWFADEPAANLGVLTDKLIVLDIDPRHDGDGSLAR